MSNKFPNKICYEYEIVDKTSPFFTHGVWGGISPQNEIEMNFYIESNKIPTTIEQYVSPDGALEQNNNEINESTPIISRHIHSRIIMNRDTAQSILEWLKHKIEILDLETNNSQFSFHNKVKLEQ